MVIEIAELGIVVIGSLLGYALVLGMMGFGRNGSGPEHEPHSGRMRLSPLLLGCVLGTVVNLLCMALLWWLLSLGGFFG